ncbi:hypothetical protein LTR95_000225 [Oleoguttula sp. CCFEE 5521]
MIALPLEVLERVSQHLDYKSLLAFSTVKKAARSASRRWIFRDLTLSFSSPTTLREATSTWQEILTASGSARCVHNVHILAPKYTDPTWSSEAQRVEDCGDHPLQSWRYTDMDVTDATLACKDADWECLVQLLEALPSLRNLTWGRSEQIPTALIKVLRHWLPKCLLHMPNFYLQSLRQLAQNPITIEDHDLQIATLPNLYSLVTVSYGSISGEYADYNELAVLDMAAGAAPGLREVSILRNQEGASISDGTPDLVRQTWTPRTLLSAPNPSEHGRLQSLELLPFWIDVDALTLWWQTTDVRKLQSLKLHTPLEPEELYWMRDNWDLPCLRTLAIGLQSDQRHQSPTPELVDATEAFLLSLPCLRSLKLGGAFTKRTLSLALQHSGESLRELYLSQANNRDDIDYSYDSACFATKDLLRSLGQHCPNLERLALSIMRRQGNLDEVGIYRALGVLRNMRHITLNVYAPQKLAQSTAAMDVAEQRIETTGIGDMSEVQEITAAIKDLAVDHILAARIFHVISCAKSTFAPHLERLDLNIAAVKDFGYFMDMQPERT